MRHRTVYFLFGFWAVLGQIIFLREMLVIFFGNEITLGLFYAVWFAGVAAGAALGSALADRVRDPFRVILRFLPVLLLTVLSGVVLLRMGRLLAGVPVGGFVPFHGMILILLPSVLPLALCVGFAFPLACRAEGAKEIPWNRTGAGPAVGAVYVYESMGSLAAGLLHTFSFAGRFDVFPLVLTLSAVTLLIATVPVSLPGGTGKYRWGEGVVFAALGAACLVLSFTGVAGSLEEWSIETRWSSFSRGRGLLRSVDSKYQNITLSRQDGQYDLYLNGWYAESFPDPYGSALEAHFVVNQHPDPGRFLVIGAGITGFLDELLLYDPERIDYVEIDAVLIDLLREYLPAGTREALASATVDIVRQDGRYFVKSRVPEGEIRYDMAVVNVPEPSNAMINRYYTVDFYRELAVVLAPGGVVVAGLPFTENYIGDEVLDYGRSVFSALAEVFEHVVVAPGTQMRFFASNAPGVVTTDAQTLELRYRLQAIESEHFSPYHYSMLLRPERVSFVRQALSGPSSVPENTDLNPVAYYYGLKLWDRYSGGGLGTLLERFEHLRLRHVAALLFCFFLLRVGIGRLLREDRGRLVRFSALFSIAGTGLTGMSVSVILMYSFQSAVGYLYGGIGLLVAVFMAGLAAGGRAGGRRAAGGREEGLLLALEVMLLLFCLGLLAALPLFGSGVFAPPALTSLLAAVLMFTGGVLTGAEFPVASALYVGQGKKLGKGAGMVDAFDHCGALAGAFLTGVLVVPVLGILPACLLIAVVKGTGVLFWLVCRWLD